METIKTTIQLTADDYLAASWLNMRPRPFFKYAGFVTLALFAFGLLSWTYKSFENRQFLSGLITMGLAGGFIAYWFLVSFPKRIRKLYVQQKSLQKPFTLEFTESHMKGGSDAGNFTMPLADFHKWKSNKQILLIYQSDALMHMIPIRFLQSELEISTLKSWLTKHLGSEKV